VQAKSYIYAFCPYNSAMQTGRPAKSKRSKFGARLHALREAAGLSQAHVANKLGIKQPSYAAWEHRTVALSHEQIQQLADILGVKAEDFFRAEESAAKRGTGPAGKLRQVFERASKLSRTQQAKVAEFVEPFVERQEKANG
jgi:transcriptional regulator with XRE-family HTH domain